MQELKPNGMNKTSVSTEPMTLPQYVKITAAIL